MFKWSGRVITAMAQGSSLFLDDDGQSQSDLVINGSTPVGYPASLSGQLVNMSANLTLGSIPASRRLFVQLLQNGVLVPGFQIIYGGFGPGSGVAFIAAGPASFSPLDQLDLRITAEDGPILGTFKLSVTVGLQ